jgi:hypothetical protein
MTTIVVGMRIHREIHSMPTQAWAWHPEFSLSATKTIESKGDLLFFCVRIGMRWQSVRSPILDALTFLPPRVFLPFNHYVNHCQLSITITF